MKEKESTLTKIETSTIVFNTLLQNFSTIKNELPAYSQNLIPSQFASNPFPNLSPIFFSNDTLPINRVETNRWKREFLSSCISLWCTLHETFPNPLQRHHSNHAGFFGLSQSDTIADRSCPSVSDRLDPPTFHTVCKDIILLMCLFS